jgi:hypothetical protein
VPRRGADSTPSRRSPGVTRPAGPTQAGPATRTVTASQSGRRQWRHARVSDPPVTGSRCHDDRATGSLKPSLTGRTPGKLVSLSVTRTATPSRPGHAGGSGPGPGAGPAITLRLGVGRLCHGHRDGGRCSGWPPRPRRSRSLTVVRRTQAASDAWAAAAGPGHPPRMASPPRIGPAETIMMTGPPSLAVPRPARARPRPGAA